MRFAFLLLLASCGGNLPPALHAKVAAPPATTTAPAVAAPVELDFEARLNGARAFGSLVVDRGVAHGTLFYANVGRDITIDGTARDGALVLHEMRGATPISTITLAGPDEMTGTFERGKLHGAASLRTIARAAGAAAFVVARPFESRRGRCVATGKRPWVLGLTDKAFERELNAALTLGCDHDSWDEQTVSFDTTLNERGLLSFAWNVESAVANTQSGFLAALDERTMLNDAVDMRIAGKLMTPRLLQEHGADPGQWCMWRGCAGVGQPSSGKADITAWLVGWIVTRDSVRFCELAGGGMKQWIACTQSATFAEIETAIRPGPLADYAREKALK